MDELLPPPLAKDQTFQLFSELGKRISALDLSPVLVYDIENVPTAALPVLAWQFSLLDEPAWALANTEAKRRELISGAIELHRFKGTPWAVRQIIRRLGYGECTLIEGLGKLSYDGSATHDGEFTYSGSDRWADFKVVLNVALGEEEKMRLRRAVEGVAPARCNLISIEP